MVGIWVISKIIDNWYNRSKDKKLDEFDRFISLWISFNAWGCHETGFDVDRKMLDDLKKNPKMEDSYNKAKESESFLKSLCEMVDKKVLTYRSKPKEVWLDNEKSLDCLLEVIYRIRCNLFHGRKVPFDGNDAKLVKWARMILTPIFDNLRSRNDFLEEK